jgi:hypothetical protein
MSCCNKGNAIANCKSQARNKRSVYHRQRESTLEHDQDMMLVLTLMMMVMVMMLVMMIMMTLMMSAINDRLKSAISDHLK